MPGHRRAARRAAQHAADRQGRDAQAREPRASERCRPEGGSLLDSAAYAAGPSNGDKAIRAELYGENARKDRKDPFDPPTERKSTRAATRETRALIQKWCSDLCAV